MNIVRRELRAGLKPFLYWTMGLFVLVFAGMTKYTGIAAGGASVGELFSQFPRVIQAMFGIVDINIDTLGGYYAVIAFFGVLCISIYGVTLGADAINRESIDKTYEFVFTKPRTRSHILCMKLLAGFIYMLVFCVLNYLCSIAAIATLKLEESIHHEIVLFSIANLLVGLLFFSMATFLSSVAKHPEKGALYGNLYFFFAFVMGILCDMLPRPGILRVLTPVRYFIASDLLAGRLDGVYACLCLLLSAGLIGLSFREFAKRDLNAG